MILNIEEVIRKGNEISPTVWEGLSHLTVTDYLFIVFFSFFITLFLSVMLITSIEPERNAVWILIVACSGIVSFLCITLMFSIFERDNYKKELIEQWKHEVAYPYIEQQPLQKSEVAFIKISNEIEYTYFGGGKRWMDKAYLTPMTISYKTENKELLTVTKWFDTSMSLTSETKPYVEYHHLKHDLPHDVKKGDYYPKIYLPEDYTFTEIK